MPKKKKRKKKNKGRRNSRKPKNSIKEKLKDLKEKMKNFFEEKKYEEIIKFYSKGAIKERIKILNSDNHEIRKLKSQILLSISASYSELNKNYEAICVSEFIADDFYYMNSTTEEEKIKLSELERLRLKLEKAEKFNKEGVEFYNMARSELSCLFKEKNKGEKYNRLIENINRNFNKAFKSFQKAINIDKKVKLSIPKHNFDFIKNYVDFLEFAEKYLEKKSLNLVKEDIKSLEVFIDKSILLDLNNSELYVCGIFVKSFINEEKHKHFSEIIKYYEKIIELSQGNEKKQNEYRSDFFLFLYSNKTAEGVSFEYAKQILTNNENKFILAKALYIDREEKKEALEFFEQIKEESGYLGKITEFFNDEILRYGFDGKLSRYCSDLINLYSDSNNYGEKIYPYIEFAYMALIKYHARSKNVLEELDKYCPQVIKYTKNYKDRVLSIWGKKYREDIANLPTNSPPEEHLKLYKSYYENILVRENGKYEEKKRFCYAVSACYLKISEPDVIKSLKWRKKAESFNRKIQSSKGNVKKISHVEREKNRRVGVTRKKGRW